MKTVPQDDRYYIDLEGFIELIDALRYAARLQFNGENRSIPIYQHGKIVRTKRF